MFKFIIVWGIISLINKLTGESRGKGQMKYNIRKNRNKHSALSPQLAEVVYACKTGQPLDRHVVQESADGQNYVDVIARVKDPDIHIPDLKVTTVSRNSKIITGTVPVEKIETVAQHDNIVDLEGPKLVYS